MPLNPQECGLMNLKGRRAIKGRYESKRGEGPAPEVIDKRRKTGPSSGIPCGRKLPNSSAVSP